MVPETTTKNNNNNNNNNGNTKINQNSGDT